MDEKMKLIDANEEKKWLESQIELHFNAARVKTAYSVGYRNALEAVISALDTAPVVDAVPVVRCRECKHWHCADEEDGVKYGECRQPKNIRAFEEIWFNENWFCADGERKDEDGKA